MTNGCGDDETNGCGDDETNARDRAAMHVAKKRAGKDPHRKPLACLARINAPAARRDLHAGDSDAGDVPPVFSVRALHEEIDALLLDDEDAARPNEGPGSEGNDLSAPLTREDLEASTNSSVSRAASMASSLASSSSAKENKPQRGHGVSRALADARREPSERRKLHADIEEAEDDDEVNVANGEQSDVAEDDDEEDGAPSNAAQPVPKREELRDRLACMLETERKYQVQDDYIECVQVDGMRPVWRSRLFEWMFEFVDEYDIGICTITTAMNYVDRYLSHVSTKKCILQLVALAAILIATKLCETRPISIQELQGLAEGIYLESDIRLMELELLRVLAWELNPVTPFAFLRHLILYFDSVDRKLRERVLSFAETFLEIVLCEYVFVQFLPSETAMASLLCAFDICNCRCTALGTSLGAVHPGRVAHCKAILLGYVREVFPEYFRAEDVASPDCVADVVGFAVADTFSPSCNLKCHP